MDFSLFHRRRSSSTRMTELEELPTPAVCEPQAIGRCKWSIAVLHGRRGRLVSFRSEINTEQNTAPELLQESLTSTSSSTASLPTTTTTLDPVSAVTSARFPEKRETYRRSLSRNPNRAEGTRSTWSRLGSPPTSHGLSAESCPAAGPQNSGRRRKTSPDAAAVLLPVKFHFPHPKLQKLSAFGGSNRCLDLKIAGCRRKVVFQEESGRIRSVACSLECRCRERRSRRQRAGEPRAASAGWRLPK